MIEVIDDVLENHVAILVEDCVKNLSWKYDYESKRGQPNKHWHVLCGHDDLDCLENGFDWATWIFDIAKKKIGKELIYERIYCNAHTHGVEPHLHVDDGEFTMIFYPRLDWKIEWGGGTAIYNDKVTEIDRHLVNKGNRLIMFDAHLPHQAQPVNRLCFQLRTCVVFKTKLK